MHDQIETNSNISHVLWERYVQAGQSALRLKNNQEACYMFELALAKCEELDDKEWRHMETLRWLSISLSEHKNFSQAESILSKLLEKLYSKFGPDSPEVLEAMRLMAVVLEKQSRYKQAAHLLQHIMQHHPSREKNRNDPDFIAVSRKYYELIKRSQFAVGHGEDIDWLG